MVITAFFFCALICAFAYVSSLTLTESRPSLKNGLDETDAATDCAVRQIAIDFADALQPTVVGTVRSSQNWSRITYAGLQMDTLCKTKLSITPSSARRQQQSRHLLRRISCDWSVYIDAFNGNDDNSGSLSNPLQTVQRGLQLSRGRDASAIAPCIIVRGGVYYFGSELPYPSSSKPSQTGALSLTAIDSNLTITSYNDEDVVFSGGRLLTPQWTLYKNTSAGPIYQSKLPADISVDWKEWNELYVDDMRAVRAKYPNGDPSTHGLYTVDTGFANTAPNFLPPKTYPSPVEIHVSTPDRAPSYFPQFQIGVGGEASVFDPPHSFWALATPPGGGGATYITPGGVQYGDFSPRITSWSNPSTGIVHMFHGEYVS